LVFCAVIRNGDVRAEIACEFLSDQINLLKIKEINVKQGVA